MEQNPYEPPKMPSDRPRKVQASAAPLPCIFMGVLAVGLGVLAFLVVYAVLK